MKIVTDLSVTSALMRPRSAWAPSQLFKAGEVGAWYDIADPLVLFTDNAGLNHAVVDGPVGLILDKSKALETGTELITNGGFDIDRSGWINSGAPVVNVSGGVVSVTQSGSSAGINQTFPLAAGQTAQITLRARRTGSGTPNTFSGVWVTGANNFTTNRVVRTLTTEFQEYTFYVVGAASLGTIYITPQAENITIEVDFISAKVLSGNHATQPTAAARPVLRQAMSGTHYLDFDGVDDQMITGLTAPATTNEYSFAYAPQNETAGVMLHATTSQFHGVFQSGSASSTLSLNLSAPIAEYWDNLLTTNTTQGQQCVSKEASNVWFGRNSGWNSSAHLRFGFYPGYPGLRRIYSFFVREGQMTDEQRAAWTTYAGNQVGVTL